MATISIPPVLTEGRFARFGRHDVLGIGSIVVVLVFLLASITAPLWVAHAPNSEGPPLAAPATGLERGRKMGTHLLGTDELGRDVLSRVVYGAQDLL